MLRAVQYNWKKSQLTANLLCLGNHFSANDIENIGQHMRIVKLLPVHLAISTQSRIELTAYLLTNGCRDGQNFTKSSSSILLMFRDDSRQEFSSLTELSHNRNFSESFQFNVNYTENCDQDWEKFLSKAYCTAKFFRTKFCTQSRFASAPFRLR